MNNFVRINHLIAEKILGWKMEKVIEEGCYITDEWITNDINSFNNDFVRIDTSRFNPSTNIQDAWKVANKLGLCIIPQSDDEGFRWYACDIEKVSYQGEQIVITPIDDSGYSADTPEMAICLCALYSIGIDITI